MKFSDIVMQRYAVKKFDNKQLGQTQVDALLELIRHSASSFNLQPWKIKIVTDKDIKEKLQAASWNQEQITTCSHLLVFCADRDLVSKRNALEKGLIDAGASKELQTYMAYIDNTLTTMSKDAQLIWSQKQIYLAVANAINGAKSLGFDSCPMEGFDAKEYSKILDLKDNFVPTVIVPIGYAADDPKPKFRFSKEEIFF